MHNGVVGKSNTSRGLITITCIENETQNIIKNRKCLLQNDSFFQQFFFLLSCGVQQLVLAKLVIQFPLSRNTSQLIVTSVFSRRCAPPRGLLVSQLAKAAVPRLWMDASRAWYCSNVSRWTIGTLLPPSVGWLVSLLNSQGLVDVDAVSSSLDRLAQSLFPASQLYDLLLSGQKWTHSCLLVKGTDGFASQPTQLSRHST